jgi:hypothetical protein
MSSSLLLLLLLIPAIKLLKDGNFILFNFSVNSVAFSSMVLDRNANRCFAPSLFNDWWWWLLLLLLVVVVLLAAAAARSCRVRMGDLDELCLRLCGVGDLRILCNVSENVRLGATRSRCLGVGDDNCGLQLLLELLLLPWLEFR